MTIAVEGTAAADGDHRPTAPAAARTPLSARAAWLAAAGILSLGAGAIHAAAIGVHAEARPAALTFTAIAAVQLVWGGVALVRSGRVVALLGIVLGIGAVAGWALAKTSGIGFVEGLDVPEPVQFVDGLAAGMAALTAVLAGVSLTASPDPRGSGVPRLPMSVVAGFVAAVSVFGMATAGTHVHDHGDGVETAAGHPHGDTAEADTAAHDADGTHTDGSAAHEGAGEGEHASGAHAMAEPVPYDPAKPIDLSGTPGVTPEQQAAAENIIAVTLHGLPQWADYRVAEAAGFHTIGDGMTGTEHFINEANLDDDVILDPDLPESLVYDTTGGGRRLVAAMYMLKRGTPMEEVPDIGGALMQWHTHENLCYFPNGRLGGLTDGNGNCRAGLIKPVPTPMIHVWIEPHRCGPFAALEGIGGGTIAAGEERLCDHAHGA
jgi:hypothetical protein